MIDKEYIEYVEWRERVGHEFINNIQNMYKQLGVLVQADEDLENSSDKEQAEEVVKKETGQTVQCLTKLLADKGWTDVEPKRPKVVGCGHSYTGSECQTCVANKELKDKYQENPKKWLKQAQSKAKFSILFFFRGSWCPYCPVYLKDVNHIVGNIRQMGGEIYAISSQKGADKLDNLKNDLNVHFDLLSDTKCILAKKFGVTTISLFDSVAKVLRKGLNFSKVKYEEEHDNELSLPAAIILNNTGRVIYKWTHSGSYRSGFGLSMRVAPLDILKVASFYFSNPTIVDSISSYVKENQEQVFETVFTNEKLCQLLVNHLKREFNVEAYEFLKDVQGFDGLVKTDRNSNKLKYECNRIYETFVSEKAPKEVNITASIRSDVRSKLNKYDETYGVAFKHVKNDMKQDTFGRFVCTKEFFDVAAEVIPQILAKDA